jgi:hypothetical protein
VWSFSLELAQVLLEISFDFCKLKTVLKAEHLYGFHAFTSSSNKSAERLWLEADYI